MLVETALYNAYPFRAILASALAAYGKQRPSITPVQPFAALLFFELDPFFWPAFSSFGGAPAFDSPELQRRAPVVFLELQNKVRRMTITQCSSYFLDAFAISEELVGCAHSDLIEPVLRRATKAFIEIPFQLPRGNLAEPSQSGNAKLRFARQCQPIVDAIQKTFHADSIALMELEPPFNPVANIYVIMLTLE